MCPAREAVAVPEEAYVAALEVAYGRRLQAE
jgi:hypothetical protein